MNLARTLMAIALLTTAIGCKYESDNSAPETILGVWKTSHPKYADRFIEIKKEFIVFGTGANTSTLHAIADVEQTRDGKDIVYTITHLNHAGQRYFFSFYYDPSNHGIMRFKHQKDILWTREGR